MIMGTKGENQGLLSFLSPLVSHTVNFYFWLKRIFLLRKSGFSWVTFCFKNFSERPVCHMTRIMLNMITSIFFFNYTERISVCNEDINWGIFSYWTNKKPFYLRKMLNLCIWDLEIWIGGSQDFFFNFFIKPQKSISPFSRQYESWAFQFKIPSLSSLRFVIRAVLSLIYSMSRSETDFSKARANSNIALK